MVTIITGGKIVTDKTEYRSDVKIENGIITEIGSIGDIVGAEVVNASGSLLFPGFVDAHTHLDMGEGITGTADNFSTGSRAALAGGTTTVIDFITQEQDKPLQGALDEWHRKADGKSYCDYGFHMGIISWNDQVKTEIAAMMEQGVSSFKLYMAYRGKLQVNDQVIYEVLKEAALQGGLVGFHCENGDIIEARIKENLAAGNTGPYYHQIARTDITEAEAISRMLQIARLTGAPVWVAHLSTQEGLGIIEDMRQKGVRVLTETCPQYLVLDSSYYGSPMDTSFEAAKYVMSPPLRDKHHQRALWQGLSTGAIQTYSSDHCSFNFLEQKELGRDDFSKIPNGGPGVEHRIPLLYSYGVAEGKLTASDLVRVGATNPAKAFGMRKKGSIAIGKDADIVIFNPEGEHTITAKEQWQNVDYTPYEGMRSKGNIERVMLRGKTVYKDHEMLGTASGRYIKREPSEGL